MRWLQELEVRWQEYYELVTLLLQWIRHHVVIFEERKFPTSYEEIEVRRYTLRSRFIGGSFVLAACPFAVVQYLKLRDSYELSVLL